MPLAFIDDSGSGGDSPYYILAGYSAPEATWAAFWPDWQAALDVAPKLQYFKMSEAESLKGQFSGFSSEQRTERVNRFIDVIQAHDLQEASIAVSAQAYRDTFIRSCTNPMPVRITSPSSAWSRHSRASTVTPVRQN